MTDLLPAIVNGTDRQIACATEIRAALIASLTLNRSEADRVEIEAAFAANCTTDAVRWIEAHKANAAILGTPGDLLLRTRLRAFLDAVTKQA